MNGQIQQNYSYAHQKKKFYAVYLKVYVGGFEIGDAMRSCHCFMQYYDSSGIGQSTGVVGVP